MEYGNIIVDQADQAKLSLELEKQLMLQEIGNIKQNEDPK